MAEFKMLLLSGEAGVGKSAVTVRFVFGRFIGDDPTIDDAFRKELSIDGKTCLLDILDTSGRETYGTMRDLHTRLAQGFLVVYSITSRQSFKEVHVMREHVLRVRDECMPFVLVGNKSDLDSDRQVSTEEGKELAKQWQVPFFETSAKDSTNVTECFTELVRQVKKANHAKFELAQERANVKHKQSKCSIL